MNWSSHATWTVTEPEYYYCRRLSTKQAKLREKWLRWCSHVIGIDEEILAKIGPNAEVDVLHKTLKICGKDKPLGKRKNVFFFYLKLNLSMLAYVS